MLSHQSGSPLFGLSVQILLVYQVLDSEEPTYQKVDDVWTDVWALRDMTAEEKSAKQQTVRDAFKPYQIVIIGLHGHLDEATCANATSIPRPNPRPNKVRC